MAGYITVLIQKSNPEGDWGFKMGPADPLASVVITQIDQSCVAAELLEAGDRIIEIEGMETSKLSHEELQTILGNPSKRLSMVVLKKNTPKELLTSVRKTTIEETTKVEETKEEIEKLKEYEVVLEVDPRESLDDILKSVKEKLERGEELDAKEMKFIATYNTRVEESSTTSDSTKQTVQRSHRPYFGNQLINTEILKRKQKFFKEQRKDDSVRIEKTKTEKEKMEEKKKKSSSFWTDPPSDLKKVIESKQFWQRNEPNEPVSTSAIFSHLNDLHNVQRKTTAREEKRQFWENCRKKYGWDPPGSKYDLSHRLGLQDDITRSRSCEPEHLDSSKKGRGQDFRETNPFFTPSPTNPFYEECRTQSLERLSRGYSSSPKYMFTAKPVNLKGTIKSTEIGSSKQTETLPAESEKTKTENREISSETSREDFNSKCEFFERATSVPVTSYVKNAQDIVSERLGTPRKSSLKKPSDFINEMKSDQKRASLSRSNSNDEKSSDLNKSALESKTTSSSMATQQKEEISSQDKSFSSMIKATATSMQRRASEKKTQMESIGNISERNRQAGESAMFKEAEKQANLEQNLPGGNPPRKEAQRQILPDNSYITSIHSESFQKSAERIEAEMNESIEKIKSESEKLRSLAFGGGNVVTGAFDQRLGSSKPEVQLSIIPDSTAFPGMQASAKVTSSTSGEFHKRSFVETSYEKVTKTGTPFENVESAWKREFRVATPSGFYDNNKEEVFKQEAHTEGFREAKIVEVKTGDNFVDESYKEITRMEGPEPTFEYNCEYRRQSNQIQNSSTDGPSPSPAGNGAPPPPPPPCAGNIPAVRIASEIGARKPCEPPAAIQNAMMTKDKKPFTYTPGGLNLNEIRSPRMARRMARNAQTDDSCSHSQPQAAVSPPGPLPPAALAAMQPQIAIPVFPPGGVPPAPPPPPPPPPAPAQAGTGVPPPPPAPGPPLPPPQIPAITRPQDLPRPEFLSDIASHPPLKPVGQPPRSSYEPQTAPPLQVQLKPVSPKPSPEPLTSQQVPFVPRSPPTTEAAQQNSAPPFQQARTPQPTPPPIQPVTPPLGSRIAPLTPPAVQSQPIRAPPTPPIQQVRPPVTPPIVGQRQPTTPPIQPQRAPPTPPTPSLNKSPAPWLTSKTTQKESVPPWTVRQPSVETPPPTPPASVQQPSQQGHQPVTRVIPIQIEGRETTPTPKTSASPQPYYNQTQAPQQYVPSPPPPYQYPAQTGNGQQHRYVQPPPNFPGYTPPPPQAYGPPPQYQQQSQQTYPQPSQSEQIRTRIIPIQLEGADNKIPPAYYSQNSCPAGNPPTKTQNGDAVDGRKFQTQTSYSGNPTQSRSFRVLQKITGSDDDAQVSIPPPQGDIILVNRVFPPQASEPESGENNGWGTNTPPTYPNYWYYPPQTPEEQQQFWEHYNAMCNYMAHMNATAMRYSPYPFPPYPYPYPPYPSDTEDYSNSSCDEMTQYGQMFKNQWEQGNPLAQNHIATSSKELTPTAEEGYEESSDSDTEVDEVQLNSIQSIRSVPDIHVYADSDESSEESESSEDEQESDTTSLPHQLSVIFEESELSSEESKKTSEKGTCESNSSSTSTINNQEEDDNAVKVRLPLQLKFTRSENDEEVATLIVGNSEMETANLAEEGSLIITDIIKEESDPDVTATIVLKKQKTNPEGKGRISDSPVDFWKELTEEEKEETSRPASFEIKTGEEDSKQEESDCHWEDDSSSTSVLTVKKGNSGTDSLSELETSSKNGDQAVPIKSNTNKNESEEEEEEDTSETSSSDDEDMNQREEIVKENIERKLEENYEEEEGEEEEEEDDDDDDESGSSDTTSSSDESDEHSNVFNGNKRMEVVSDKKKENTLVNSKSFEESEEDDSGVTSDISRHISETDTDPECGSELSKMTRCQRAATHSRLFKLLQEECEQEDAKEFYENVAQRKERLTLPLSSCNGDDSLSSSSGINSPSSPGVNERLVKELIQSLLSKKKGRHFRKLPMEKLHAAALRILQEDMDQYDSVSTSDESNFFLSPVSNPVKASTKTPIDPCMLNPESYGVNYYDYYNYYSTWGAVSNDIEPDYDIVPSKTFKILQGQSDRYSPQTVKGVPSVRCPRVPTSKNLRENLSTPIPPGSSALPKES